MVEQEALAYVNMYGVLGALEDLCRIDEEARAIVAGIETPVALCLAVTGGPCCTFSFSKDGCTMTEGEQGCNAKMSFASPEKFNAFIAEAKPGTPTKGLVRTLKFLTGPFTRLTDRLSAVLQAKEEDLLADRALFEENTIMTMYVIAGAIPALANHDSISRVSASNTVDGEIQMGIKDCVTVSLQVADHVFKTVKAPAANPRAIMEFADLDLAWGLFNGKVSTINELCKGTIHMAGMISMIDNVNRILDRVAVYLA